MIGRRTALAGAILFASVLSGCTTNPTTGRSQLAIYSRDEEIAMGAQAMPELTKEFGGKVKNADLQGYVADIGRKLAAVTEADNPSLPWEFTLLDSDVINAFALPGGKVFVSRGLAARMTNEAQLAAVVGHEIGHVTARHTNERMGQSTIAVGLGTLLGAAAGAEDAGSQVGQLVSLSFSRDQEIEADRLGMRYMEKLKYNPVGAIQVQEILLKASTEGGGSRPPEILSTHPPSEKRIAELKNRMAKYYQHTVNNPEYQLFEDRFRDRFLKRMAALPPALHRDGNVEFGLAYAGAPGAEIWCVHCAPASHGNAARP
ncbi:MAG: M48 family metalloprotease [Phycisphaerae bacterium]|nr:M48 family metalloprotease [Phycisphaerae bacterium]